MSVPLRTYFYMQPAPPLFFLSLADSHISLIGLSSISGAFNETALKRMAELNQQPIVFPLSNPATQAECTFEQAMKATDERVIFASGTAFPAYTSPSGKVHYADQGNNMYCFPGIGLGGCLSEPKHISDRMIYTSAKALAESVNAEEQAQGRLYPSLKRIRPVSVEVAAAVMEEAAREGLATVAVPQDRDELFKYVNAQMWTPEHSDETLSRI